MYGLCVFLPSILYTILLRHVHWCFALFCPSHLVTPTQIAVVLFRSYLYIFAPF